MYLCIRYKCTCPCQLLGVGKKSLQNKKVNTKKFTESKKINKNKFIR